MPSDAGIPPPTGGTTRTFGNMIGEKTRLNVPKKKPLKKVSGWEGR